MPAADRRRAGADAQRFGRGAKPVAGPALPPDGAGRALTLIRFARYANDRFLRQRDKGESDMTNQLIVSAKPSAARGGKPVLHSVVTPVAWTDPAAFFARHSRLFSGSRFFWSEPDRHMTLVGLGEALSLETQDGANRFREADRLWRDVVAAAALDGEAPAGAGPLLFGGFAFDPHGEPDPLWRHFPPMKLTVPRYLLTVRGDRAWLTVNRLASPDGVVRGGERELDAQALLAGGAADAGERRSTPGRMRREERDAEAWMAAVARAAAAVRDGELDKVVLARRLLLAADEPFRPEPILRRLMREQPNTYVFAIERGDSCLIGATPERLIRKEGNRLLTLSLAGSAARGRTEEEDRRLGGELLRDRKNMLEHALAVDMIRDVLARFCHAVRLPDAPLLHKLTDIQHLLTPIEGEARGDVSLLDAVEALHPTPALGGMPKASALAMIREMEGMDRGWYAAPVGWIDWRMDGEFAAAIRSALLQGKEAVLFAGCGIVGDSDPLSEYRETRLKFQPMLSAMGALDAASGEGEA